MRALLALVRDECPQYVGGFIPRPDLEACYRELCMREGWEARHWTAIARQLGEITDKKSVRDGGDRFMAYRIPKARTYAAPRQDLRTDPADRKRNASDCFAIGSAGRIRTYDQPVNSRWLYH
jgi:hypothetical protein